MKKVKDKSTHLSKATSKVEAYRQKITEQFDEIEQMMVKQLHLTDPQSVEEKLYGVEYKWHFISEEDRDFYQGCKFALENGLKW